MVRQTSWLPLTLVGAMAVSLGIGVSFALQSREYKSGVIWPEPPVVTPGQEPGAPPSDAIVLFDGKDLSKWEKGENWKIENGYAIVQKSDITTKDSFGDMQLHVEFATPENPPANQKGQGRGNSGVYIMGRYEVQILDSFENATYFDGQCASLYKQQPPMVNACRKPGEWQTFDIVFEAPRFAEDGKVLKPAIVTVFHNGVCVQNHFELHGGTFFDRPAAYSKHAEKLPFRLQNHGNPLKFRNIWVRELKPIVGKKPEPKEETKEEKKPD
jgi:hypothetical protein